MALGAAFLFLPATIDRLAGWPLVLIALAVATALYLPAWFDNRHKLNGAQSTAPAPAPGANT